MVINKTKVIATLGPAIKKKEILAEVLDGIDVLRFNFSHLSPEQARKDLRLVRAVLARKKKQIGFLADLKGPEIRTDNNEYFIKNGEIYKIIHGQGDPSNNEIGIDFAGLAKKITSGHWLKADDGGVEFKVKKIEKKSVFAEAKNDYSLKSRKSFNVVKTHLGLPIISQRDKENLAFIAKENFSWVAASFISSKKDVLEIRKFLKGQGSEIPIIAKIENYSAIQNIDEIIEVSEGIMVARGDLGVEYSYAEVPILQRMIVEKSQRKGKVIIVATQMLDSMIKNPSPSRPEATDVSTAVVSRVDAVMLSGETANGAHPLKAIEAMNNIINKTEENLHRLRDKVSLIPFERKHEIIPFLKYGINLAQLIESKCTITLSERGKSPVFLSAFKANQLNVVATSNVELFHRIHLYYGIYPVLINKTFSRKKNSQSEILEIVLERLKENEIVSRDDSIVFLFSFIYKNVYRGINSIREIKVC